MLNYLWAGMLLLGIVFSIVNDVRDEINNTYANKAEYTFSYHPTKVSGQVTFRIGNAVVKRALNGDEKELLVSNSRDLPDLWQQVAKQQSAKNKTQLRTEIIKLDKVRQQITLRLPEVHWVKVRAVSNAAFDMAKFAVKLAIGLAGIMVLWLGLMRIAEKSGLITYFVRLIYPLLRWLFPRIEKNHPVLGSISLNMAANVLGLGNAATPMGIKAMQQLQEINRYKDKASDEMCMFLAINTSSVQLLPPVTLIAIMGAGVSELIVPIILATTASTLAAVITAKVFARLRNQ